MNKFNAVKSSDKNKKKHFTGGYLATTVTGTLIDGEKQGISIETQTNVDDWLHMQLKL